jgi:hypothetical protein
VVYLFDMCKLSSKPRDKISFHLASCPVLPRTFVERQKDVNNDGIIDTAAY